MALNIAPRFTIGTRTLSLMPEDPVNNIILSLYKALPLRKIMQRCPRTIPVRHVGLKPVNRQHLLQSIVIHPICRLGESCKNLSRPLPLPVVLGVNRGRIDPISDPNLVARAKKLRGVCLRKLPVLTLVNSVQFVPYRIALLHKTPEKSTRIFRTLFINIEGAVAPSNRLSPKD